MRDYAKVSPQFWIGQTGKRLRSSGFEAQIVAMYLMTSPHANMLGLFYCPEMFIAHETGLGFEGASKGLQRCFEAGFCEYDKASEVVWVYEMATYQIAVELTGKDLRIKGVQNEYDAIPENPYLARFFAKYGEAFKMENCRGYKEEEASPLQAPCKPLRSQEQEQEQEQYTKPPIAPQGGQSVGNDAGASENQKRRQPSERKVTFSKWIDEVRANGEKAVSDYAPVWKYADDCKLPYEFIELAWVGFKDYYHLGLGSGKRQADWRLTFLNNVKKNYQKLWFWSEKDSKWTLTTAGVQADRAAEVAA